MGSESQSVSFHPHVLGTVQQKVLRQLGPLMATQRLYLGGGTALAIHLGHRRSVDFDWFTRGRITDPLRLAQDLNDQGVGFVMRSIERGTLHGSVSGVQVSFLEYRYALLQPVVVWSMFGCVLAYSLAYFDDAERERMPRMFWDSDWRTIKKTIAQWVRGIGI